MRIISGARRGKKLIAPTGERIRPTTDRVKEALFAILQFRIPGCVFLDLFAGSGQVGLEAISRGARKAVFVDDHRESLELVRKNAALTGFLDKAELVGSDFADYLARSRELFDVAFLDPPYGQGLIERALPLLEDRLRPEGVVFCEHPAQETPPETLGRLVKGRVYHYGKTALTGYSLSQDVR